MEPHMTTKKAALTLSALIGFLVLTLIIPARYLGVERVKRPSLILRSTEDLAKLRGDRDNNGTPDWRDMLNEQSSSTSRSASGGISNNENELAQKRLDDPNNITASLSKNLYTATAYAKKQGNLSTKEQEALAIKIVEEEGAKLTFKEYGVVDLNLTKIETDTSRKAYINSLGITYKKTLASKINAGDITIIEEYNRNKNVSSLESLKTKKNALDSIISDLVAIPVPYSGISYHLLLINSLSKYASILENISVADVDPVRAAIAYNSYLPSLQNIYMSFTSLQSYITVENITFTVNDPGYLLTMGSKK